MVKVREVKYTQISFSGCKALDDLLEVYRKDKVSAGVIFRFKKERLITSRLCIFEEGRGQWDICKMVKVWGINKNNKLYSKETKTWSIKSINGNVWYRSKFNRGDKYDIRYFKPTHFNYLTDITGDEKVAIKAKLLEKLPFLSYIYEFNILGDCTIHTIKKNKLFSLKKAIQYEYGISKDTYYRLKKHLTAQPDSHGGFKLLGRLKAYSDILLNVEKFNTSWLSGNSYSLFMDTLGCAKALGKTINCAWSDRRLNDEHNAYTQEIIKVLYKDDVSPLTLKDVFIKFGEFSGFNLLKTVNEVYIEGLLRHHCVATHIPNINNGSIGVYNINNLYTLELATNTIYLPSTKDEDGVHISGGSVIGVKVNEFRGYQNSSVPSEVVLMVNEKINEFNLSIGIPMDRLNHIYNKKSNDLGFLMDNDEGDRFLEPAKEVKQESFIDIF